MDIITAYKGENIKNVYADDDRAMYAGIVGTGCYVLHGQQLKVAPTADEFTFQLSACYMMMQGALIVFEGAETFSVLAAAQGYYRHDLLCIRYSRGSDGVETAVLTVVQGQASADDPKDPDITQGNILAGADLRYEPIVRVYMYGAEVQQLEIIPKNNINLSDATAMIQEAVDPVVQDAEEKIKTAYDQLVVKWTVENGVLYAEVEDAT